MKRIFTLLASVMMFGVIVAAPISEDEAREIAKSFLKSKTGGNVAMSLNVDGIETVETALKTEEYYVFNGDGSYVIVSGDDGTVPVLGWSSEGTFDAGNVNQSVQLWLDNYSHEIQSLQGGAGLTATLSSWDEITPMVKTKWDQPAPYNNMVPKDSKTGKASYVGCPAVSLAQVLAYHRYPNTMLRGIPEQNVYETKNGKDVFQQYLEALPAATFNWDKLKETYNDPTETGEAVDEVAKLMKYCGYALGMSYSSTGSGSPTLSLINALRLYFGYNTMHLSYRGAYTSKQWEETIYNELKEKRPIIHDASADNNGSSSGHSFIIDGYRNGYYHINWGWGGQADGYFVLSVLNSDYPEEKGLTQSGGYSYYQSILLGLEPPKTEGTSDTYAIALESAEVNNGEYKNVSSLELTRTSTSEYFPMFEHTLGMTRYMAPFVDRKYQLGWNLYDFKTKDNVFEKPLEVEGFENMNIASGHIEELKCQSILPNELANGTYALQWYYRDLEAEDNNWYQMTRADELFLYITIKGKKATLAPSNDYLIRYHDMTTNTKEVVGTAEVYKPTTVKYNLTNNSLTTNRPLFLWVSTDDKYYYLTNGAGANIDRGESGDVYLQFTPYSVGTYHVILNTTNGNTYDQNSDVDGSYMKVSITGTSMSAEVTNIQELEYSDYSQRTVTTNAIEGKTYMTTTDELPCQKTMYVVLRYYDEKEELTYSTDPAAATNCKIDANFTTESTATGTFKFENLKFDDQYKLAIGRVEDGKIVVLDGYSTTYFTPEASAVEAVSERKLQGNNRFYDLMGRLLNGKPARKGLYIYNNKVIVAE